MSRFPLLIGGLAFAAGIYIGQVAGCPSWIWGAVMLVFILVAVLLYRYRNRIKPVWPVLVALYVAFAAAGAWRMDIADYGYEAKTESIEYYRPVEWKGEITSIENAPPGPEQNFRKDRVYLRLTEFNQDSLLHSDPLGVLMRTDYIGSLTVGDVLKGSSIFYPISKRESLQGFDPRVQYYRKGAFAELKYSEFEKTGEHRKSLGSMVYDFHQKIRKALIRAGVDEREAGLAQAVLFGNRNYLDETVRQDYTDAGVAHVLTVSGLHVGIVAALLVFVSSLFFANRKWRLAMVIIPLWIYAVFTGLHPAVIRAAGMFTLLYLCYALGRDYAAGQVLGILALVNLMISPLDLFYVGFQLSYLAVLAIIFLYPQFRKRIKVPKNKFLRYFVDLSLISFSVQLALTPVILYDFSSFPVFFLLSNLIIVPLISLTIVPAGFFITLFALLGIKASWLYDAYSWIIRLSNAVAAKIAEWDISLIGPIRISLTEAVLLMCIVVILWLSLAGRKRMVYLVLALSILISVGVYWLKQSEDAICRDPHGGYDWFVHQGGRYDRINEDSIIRLDNGVSLISGDPAQLPVADSDEGSIFMPSSWASPDNLPFLPQVIILNSSLNYHRMAQWADFARSNGVPVYDTRLHGPYRL